MPNIGSKLVPAFAGPVLDADRVGETENAKVLTAQERADIAALKISNGANGLRFYATLAAGLAATAVGEFFTSNASGQLKRYEHATSGARDDGLVVDKAAIGLGAYPDTPTALPISTAQQAALDVQAALASLGALTALQNQARTADINHDYPNATYRIDGVRQAGVPFSVSRAAVAYALAANGAFQSFNADQARVTDTGLTTEPAATCIMRNTALGGVVVGSPGTLPTGWALSGNWGGLSRQILDKGTRKGIPFFKVRVTGTPTSTSNGFYTAATTAIGATPSQSYSGGVRVEIDGTSPFTGVTGILGGPAFRDSGGAGLPGPGGAVPVVNGPAADVIHPLFGTGVAPASTSFVTIIWNFTCTPGTPIDATFYIYMPQLEPSAALSTPILNTSTTGPATRPADTVTVQLGAGKYDLLMQCADGGRWLNGVVTTGTYVFTPTEPLTIRNMIAFPSGLSAADKTARSDALFPVSFADVYARANPNVKGGDWLFRPYSAALPRSIRAASNRRSALRFEVQTGDKAIGDVGRNVDRSELVGQGVNTVYPYGTEIWWSYEHTIVQASDGVGATWWCVTGQWHQLANHPVVTSGVNPPFSITWRTDGHRGIAIYTRAQSTAGLSPSGYIPPNVIYVDDDYPVGKPVRWVWRVKFGWNGNAIVQGWRDGVLVVSLSGPAFAMGYEWDAGANGGAYPQLGIYRNSAAGGSGGDPNPMIVDYANVEVSLSSLASRIATPLPRS